MILSKGCRTMEKETEVFARLTMSRSPGIIMAACLYFAFESFQRKSSLYLPDLFFCASPIVFAFFHLPKTQNADAKLLIQPWSEVIEARPNVSPWAGDIPECCGPDWKEKNSASHLLSAASPSNWDQRRKLCRPLLSSPAEFSSTPKTPPLSFARISMRNMGCWWVGGRWRVEGSQGGESLG